MATPRFWYYPVEDGSLEEIDVGGALHDLQDTPLRARSTALNGIGSPQFSVWGGGYTVRIVRERALTAAVVRALAALEDHLHRGGRVAFTADQAKAWAAYYMGAGGYMERGRSLVYTPGAAFTAWSASAALASGDEVAIESANPEYIREVRTITSVSSGGDVSLAQSMIFTRNRGGLIRHKNFYPCLYLPDDQVGKPIVSHEHGLTYTLDVTLQLDPAILDLASDDDGDAWTLGLADAAAVHKGDNYSIEGLLRARTTRGLIRTTVAAGVRP